ncbi:MAG: hypothetical protein ABIK82_09330 [Pseudomonadota bacterium]
MSSAKMSAKYSVFPLSPQRLIDILNEAASDTYGGNATPRLYDLLDLYASDKRPDKLREQLVSAVDAVITHSLSSLDESAVFQLRVLLNETELIDDSRAVRETVQRYVDARLRAGDENAIQFAVGIMRTAEPPAKSAAGYWLPVFRELMKKAPSWLLVDALMAVQGLVSENEYSEHSLIEDILLLRQTSDFSAEFDRRVAELAKLWGVTQQRVSKKLNMVGLVGAFPAERLRNQLNVVAHRLPIGQQPTRIGQSRRRASAN